MNFTSSVEDELIKIFRRELEALSRTDKYVDKIDDSDLESILRAFELALSHGEEKVTVQMIYDYIAGSKEDRE
jgi:hypothetical protein